jgi:hypothetical protein
MRLLSTEDHLIGHPRVWSDRLPVRFRDSGRVIVDRPREGGGPPAEV